MNIAIIDYGMGNTGSILNMLKYLNIEAKVTSDAEEIKQAKKIILPGVGAFDEGMANLKKTGLFEVLNEKILADKTPILGICLGMQLMTKRSDEGKSDGFGWIDATTGHFDKSKTGRLRVPHTGWNRLQTIKKNALTEAVEMDSKFYFTHSFRVQCDNQDDSIGNTAYGEIFDSIVAKDNIFGCQFHPEKSHKYGMKIFENFNKL